tara:strand:- start:318 stop:578 length:261 start_codon:yes stop_codon:yes gene_type:complete
MKRYQNIEFSKKYSIRMLESFFKKFPEEKRGRKKFKEKEIQNVMHLLYDKILKKGIRINADCIGSIIEKVDKGLVTIKVSYFRKNE